MDELPPVAESNDDPNRREADLIDIVPKDPRKVYKMHRVKEAAVDLGSFFEIGRKWGRSIICGLARLDGIPIALFAENPAVYGGAWTADSCRKVTRLIDLAALFHLPIVHLVDCPGFLIGKQSEHDATIRFGSQALAALGQANVPFMSVMVRKAFGVAGGANHLYGPPRVCNDACWTGDRQSNRAGRVFYRPSKGAISSSDKAPVGGRWKTRLRTKEGDTLLGKAATCEAWLPERLGRKPGWGRRKGVPTRRVPSRVTRPRCIP